MIIIIFVVSIGHFPIIMISIIFVVCIGHFPFIMISIMIIIIFVVCIEFFPVIKISIIFAVYSGYLPVIMIGIIARREAAASASHTQLTARAFKRADEAQRAGARLVARETDTVHVIGTVLLHVTRLPGHVTCIKSSSHRRQHRTDC